MKYKSIVAILTLLVAFTLVLSACAAPAPQVVEVEKTVVVEKEVEVVSTVVVEKEVVAETFDASTVLGGMKMAAVLSGPVNDAGWNTNAYLALTEARDNYGIDIAYTESVKVEDAAQVMRDYAEAGYTIIMAHGYEYADQAIEVAKEYPDIKFIHTNGVASDIPNLYTVGFSVGEGGYFMGWLACKISQSGKVGFIIGTQFPAVEHQVKMARAACADTGSNAEVVDTYVGSWADPAKTKELAKAAIEQGTDVIIMLADAGDTGGIEAAKEAYDAGNTNLRIISWVKDKNYLGPEFVLGGWSENVALEVDTMLQLIAQNQPGGHFALGMQENVVYTNPMYGLVPQEVELEFVDMVQKYLADPSSLPSLEVRKDL
jgi:basic membrane protein A